MAAAEGPRRIPVLLIEAPLPPGWLYARAVIDGVLVVVRAIGADELREADPLVESPFLRVVS
jgi:hypothetical protein